jgi:two-component system, cell cycle sensor histidine kinase and response regulator CckA
VAIWNSLPPSSARAPAPEADAPCRAAAPGESATILVVDDNHEVCHFISKVLLPRGYTVLPAFTPAEAIRAAAAQALDLLIVDLGLPQMDGLTLAARLKAAQPGLRTIYISGYPGFEMEGITGAASEAFFLKKPFLPDLLLAKVREALAF